MVAGGSRGTEGLRPAHVRLDKGAPNAPLQAIARLLNNKGNQFIISNSHTVVNQAFTVSRPR